MTLAAPIRYPAGKVTPHGAFHFLKGTHPHVTLTSWDDSVKFTLMGGPSIPDPFDAPECVRINGPIKGLIAGWKFIDQQGANEDGVTYIDSANEPGVIEIPVRCVARDGAHLRQVVDHLLSSIAKDRVSRLSWFTFERGMWWADVRWADKPPGGLKIGGQHRSIELTLVLRVDKGSWQTYPDVAEFSFGYDTLIDTFSVDYADEKIIGPDWNVYLSGPTEAYPYAINGAVRMSYDSAKHNSATGRTYIATHKTFESTSNKQVVEITLDSMIERGGKNYILGRAGRKADGTWNGYGVGAEIENGDVALVSFNNFQMRTLRVKSNVIMPVLTERWRLECGGLDTKGKWNDRIFNIKRGLGTFTVLSALDESNITPLGSQYRGAGFGGYAAGSTFSKGRPAAVTRVTAGDSAATSTLKGSMRRINIGSEDRYDEYTCRGPGTFYIAAAAGSKDMVKFGPLLPGQEAQLRTDQRERSVVDITRDLPIAEALVKNYPWLQDWMKVLQQYIGGGDSGPLQQNKSAFGIPAPQGNLGKLLDGAFTRPIPPRSANGQATVVQVAVEIVGGDASSQILASGVSLRKYPN